VIKDWVFGEVRNCGFRKCGIQFIALWGKRGQRQLYCSPAHQKAEGQAAWQERKKVLNLTGNRGVANESGPDHERTVGT